MKAATGEYPSYQYQIDDWEFKKKGAEGIKEVVLLELNYKLLKLEQTNKKSWCS